MRLSEEDRRGSTRRSPTQDLTQGLTSGLTSGPIAGICFFAATSACVIQSPSFDEYGGESATSSSSSSTSAAESSASATSGPTTSSSTAAETTTSDSDTTTSAGSTSTTTEPTSSSSTGEATTGGEDAYPVSSCTELKIFLAKRGEAVTSGVYTINLPDSAVPVEVYCDLEIANGGWLLVGRSVAFKPSEMFGWHSGTGTLDDDDEPYSLNLEVNPFPFKELLIGTWSEGKEWGENVYRYTVPDDLMTHTDDLVPTTFQETVRGECKPDAGPSMLTYIGATAKTSAFFFRNKDEIDGADYGLLHDMLWTYYIDDCKLGGMLAQQQGMIMVR